MEKGEVCVEGVDEGGLAGGEAEERNGGVGMGGQTWVGNGGGDEAGGETNEEGLAERFEVGFGGGRGDEEGEDADEPGGGFGVTGEVGEIGDVDVGLDPLRRGEAGETAKWCRRR